MRSRPLLTAAATAAALFAAPGAGAAQGDAGVPLQETLAARPSVAHLKYQSCEIMALVCWGLNPYTGQEWGFGNVPPAKITAKRLDPAQWARAMRAGGITRVVLVAKHHDGFCLWPSPLNRDYSMSAVPAPNTGRDLVRELADACRGMGMEFGVYLSPWDRHQGSYATPAYVDYFFAQWNELLDNYGEMSEIWLDGANGGTGWYGGVNGDAGERRSIPKGYYRLDELLETMHRKHPLAIAFGGGGAWSSKWCGNESGVNPETWWCPRRGRDGKTHWTPSETDFPLRRGWYWHANEKPKSLARLVKIYFESVGRGSIMNIGVAPDVDGQVCPDDAKRLAEFGEWVRDFNSADLAKGAKATERREGNRLVVELSLPEPAEFNCVDLMERIADGQRISGFTVEAPDGDGWRKLSGGTTVGRRRLARVPLARYGRIRVTLDGLAPPQLLPVALRRGRDVAHEGIMPAADAHDKAGWRIVGETCAAPGNAKMAIDGNYSSLWHSHAKGRTPLPPPQSFTVDCGRELLMHGFDYMPRNDGCRHGVVDGYEFHVSMDGKAWTKASSGEFGNVAANPSRQRMTFERPVKARFFRFTATHSIDANDRVAVAEIDLW